jgi:Glycine/sarcosine/betaine reductase component B subunits
VSSWRGDTTRASPSKARSAHFVAKLARVLGASGALCTYEATGNTHVDFMLTVQALERAGLPAASVVHEYGGPEGIDPTLVDVVPEAIALASSGAIDRWLSGCHPSSASSEAHIWPTVVSGPAAS